MKHPSLNSQVQRERYAIHPLALIKFHERPSSPQANLKEPTCERISFHNGLSEQAASQVLS